MSAADLLENVRNLLETNKVAAGLTATWISNFKPAGVILPTYAILQLMPEDRPGIDAESSRIVARLQIRLVATSPLAAYTTSDHIRDLLVGAGAPVGDGASPLGLRTGSGWRYELPHQPSTDATRYIDLVLAFHQVEIAND